MAKKTSPVFVGLLQAVGVGLYCLLMGAFFRYGADHFPKQDTIFTGSLMMIILVFSAAVTGLTVFGRPAYLFLNKKAKEALLVLGYTFIFLLFIIALSLFTILM